MISDEEEDDALLGKIKEMEGKLLSGDKVVDRTAEMEVDS